MSVLLLAATLFATDPLRDPFWPVGFEGKRWAISVSPRCRESKVTGEAADKAAAEAKSAAEAISKRLAENESRLDEADNVRRRAEENERLAKAAAERAAADRKAREMEARWSEALKTLRFGGAIQSRSDEGDAERAAVLINGRARTEGDIVRVDFNGYRFAWRIVKSADDRKLMLERVKAVSLEKIKEGMKK